MQDYDIVYCGSDYIVSSLVSSITSILKNVKVKNTINFHILDFEIAKPKKDKIISVVDRYNNRYDYAQWGTDEQDKQFNVFFHKPILGRSNKEKLEFYKSNYNPVFPDEFYLYKLFLQDIFSDLDSCLFLSGSIVAKECVSKIFENLSFDEHFAIVSKSNDTHKILEDNSIFLYIQKDGQGENFCKHFKRKVYFNPDMLLLNLRKMREKDISQHFYAYAVQNLHSPYKDYIDSVDGILRLGFEDYVKVSSF